MRNVNVAAVAVSLVLLAGPASAQFVPGAEFHNQPALTAINILPAYKLGLSGAGMRIGVADSGINPDHVEFRGAILAGLDAISGLSGTREFSSFLLDHVNHGTAVASVAAARLDGDPRPNNIQGVAYNAGLVIGAMNFVYNDTALDTALTDRYAATALDFVSRQGVRVINSSWVWGEAPIDPRVDDSLADYHDFLENAPLTNAAIKTALERGSVVVFATGNDGSINPLSPSTLPTFDAEVARVGALISVTASSIDGQSLASYANRCGISRAYCITAPGGGGEDGPAASQSLLGADAWDGANDAYFHAAGTSLAVPIVSGAVAIVAEQFPWMSNTNLATTILSTGTRASAPDVEWGRGLLDVGKAIRGPALFETEFEARVSGGYTSVFSNDIGYRPGFDGGLVKLGEGTLALTGSNTYTGQTRVDAGTLVVNGNLSSPVTVASDGTLRGVGKLSAVLTVNGTLAPGDLRGTLEVGNTVTMGPGSTFQVSIDGTTADPGLATHSRLLVSGVGSQFIANGVIQPVLHGGEAIASSHTTPALGDTFRVVSAEGGIAGRFALLEQPSGLTSGTQLVAFYDVFSSRSIDLRAAPSAYAAYLGGSNANTRSTAGALDEILRLELADGASTAQTQLLYVTAGKSASALPGFARSLSGEIHGAVAAATPQASQRLERVLAQRLGFRSPTEAAGEPALWLDVGSTHRRRKADSMASGFTGELTQLTLGAELLAAGSTRFGVGLSHADTDISAHIGRASLSETIGFAYLQHAFADLLFEGMAGYGSGSTDTSRPDPTALTLRFESGTTTANTLLNARVSKPLVISGRSVAPFASVSWQQTRRSAYHEGDAVAALGVAGGSDTGVRTLAGFALSSLVHDPLSSRATHRLSLGLGHDAGGLTRPKVSAALAGIGSTITAPKTGRAFMQADVSGTVRFDSRAYGYLGLNAEVREGLQDVGINAGVVVVF